MTIIFQAYCTKIYYTINKLFTVWNYYVHAERIVCANLLDGEIMNQCIFCDIIADKAPATKIMETDTILVIKDIVPKASVHYLLIPKKHIPDIQSLSAQDLAIGKEIFATCQELARNHGDFRLIINNGADAGQCVFHLHAHFLAGEKIPTF